MAFLEVTAAALALALPGASEADWFAEVSSQVGIEFQHQDGRSGEKYFIETTASGGGWLDYDGDGDLDLYLVNGAATPGSKLESTPTNTLYENRGGRFADVTSRAGVGDTGFGMGLCAGDYDADGRLDFLVTNYGPDRLYRNLGEGKFQEVGAGAGVAESVWCGSCAFGDLDGDGDLDLYVTHYVVFDFAANPPCGDRITRRRVYCHPSTFDGLADSLFINQGDGTFLEEGAKRGIARGPGEKGMGVVLVDLDRDGDLDAYVANDGTLNRLYLNDGRGVFSDASLASGAGLNAAGAAEAGMGIAVGDLAGDGRLHLAVTNFALETNTLYRTSGAGHFEDVTHRAGLGRASYPEVGWGIAFFDYDNDGDLDMAVANGHVQEGIEEFEPGLSYRQRNQLFENLGDGRLREVTESAGAAWAAEKVSRALAVGDWNDDGRLDLLVTNANEGVDLLENRYASANHWLGVVLTGPPANPFAIGARVELEAGGRRQGREVMSGGGFQAQSDLRLHFGLGGHQGPVSITIRWPDGREQRETTSELDRYWTLAYRPQK